MRKLLVVALALVVLTGCPKKKDKDATTAQPGGSAPGSTAGAGSTSRDSGPSSTVVVQGSGGAVQSVRKAVHRTIDFNELKNIHTFMYDAYLSSGKMPTAQQTSAALQQAAPKTFQLVKDGAIILTDTQRADGVWAYTAQPVSPAGEYLVCLQSEVKRITRQELDQRLQQR